MQEAVLMEVTTPSGLFMAERSLEVPGAAVIPSLEGSRPILVEVQALVSPSSLAQPRRQSMGVDPGRVSLLVAILEKRVGLAMGGQDLYVNVAGGVRLTEPAADLGVAMALASSFLDRPVPAGPAHARIDRERRLRHMQHHPAPPLLNQCFLRLFDLETVSANINGYTPSTLDLPAPAVTKEQLDRAEELANELIYADLPVKAYFVSPEAVNALPLRKQPKVKENIRVVEIEGFDWTPCGGTHSPATGSLGALKIIKTERQNEKTRVHFMAGRQAQ